MQFCGPPLTAAKWSLTLTLTDGRCAVNASRFCQHAYRSGMETEGIQLLIIYFTLACSWGSCPRWPWLITASIPKYICFLLNFVRTLIQWWSPSRSGNFKCVFCILARFFACAYVITPGTPGRFLDWPEGTSNSCFTVSQCLLGLSVKRYIATHLGLTKF